MTRLALLVLFLATPALAGCMNGSSDPTDPANGGAADPQVLAAAWKSGAPELTGVLGSDDGQSWPGPIATRPLSVDIDGDGTMELVVQSRDRHVHVFSTEGDVLARLRVPYPPSWHIDQVLNEVVAGQLRPDGPVTLVVTTPAAYVIAWEYDEAASGDGALAFSKAWQARADGCHRSPGMDARATLADLDGAPGMEILVQTEQVGFFAYTGTGEVLWKQCWAGGNAAAAADDLDGDGDIEAVFASDSGFISVLDGATGAPVWTFDAAAAPYSIDPASVTVAPVIAELDGTGNKEVLFTARYAPDDDPRPYSEFHMAIFAVHQDPESWQAEVLWYRQPEWANPLSYTEILVEDVDGDGRADVFGMDWNTIGHSPGEWEPFPYAHAFRLDDQGNDVWVRDLETFWSNKAIALGDLDGDGTKELLVNAPKGEADGLWRLDVADGKSEGFLTTAPWNVASGPTLFSGPHDRHIAVSVADPDDPATAAVLVYKI